MLKPSYAKAETLHLAEISACVTLCADAVVTLDGAGWHQPGDKLKVPDNISLPPLPPYSQELNPTGPSTVFRAIQGHLMRFAQEVWQYLRQNHLFNRVLDTYDTIVDACRDAWNKLIAQPKRITSITTRSLALQVRT